MYQSIIDHCYRYVTPTSKDLDFLISKLSKITVSKKKFLLEPGIHIREQYFVIKGCLRAFYVDDKGNHHTIQFAIEDWWVADFDTFYNDLPSKLYLEALEDSTLLAMSYKDMEQLYKEAPIFERYFRILLTGAFNSHRKRILSSLEKDTKDRYLEFCSSYSNIENRIPNYHIANYLGVSAESLSRIRTALKADTSE